MSSGLCSFILKTHPVLPPSPPLTCIGQYDSDSSAMQSWLNSKPWLASMVVDDAGNTPLHIVQSPEEVLTLLEHGGDMNATNKVKCICMGGVTILVEVETYVVQHICKHARMNAFAICFWNPGPPPAPSCRRASYHSQLRRSPLVHSLPTFWKPGPTRTYLLTRRVTLYFTCVSRLGSWLSSWATH